MQCADHKILCGLLFASFLNFANDVNIFKHVLGNISHVM